MPSSEMFSLENLTIEVGLGRASYHMSRGTFKTTDDIKKRIRLLLVESDDHHALFAKGDVELTLQIKKEKNSMQISFSGAKAYNRMWITLPAQENEHIYGCGEQFTHFNLKKKSVDIWVSEHHSIKKLIKKFLREKFFGVNPNHIGKFKEQQTYYAQPSFMSSLCYFVHADAQSFMNFTFKTKETILFFRQIPKSITYLFEDDFIQLAEAISLTLGKQQPLPEWTEKGAIIASQGGIKKVKEHLLHASNASVPVVGIWCQDWSGQLLTSFGSQVFWNWEVDQTLYENLKEEISILNKKGIHFLGYINTFLKEDTPLYTYASNHGYLVKNLKNENYLIQSTTFKAGIVDLTHPEACTWYKAIIKTNMIGIGMSGWMADFGEYLPTDSIIHGGDPKLMHNLWPSLWAQLNMQAIQEANRAEDVFFFTRAGFTETIKYTNTMWAGDQHVDFSKAYGFPSVIVSTLSMSTIGIGLNHSDIGGYTTILHMTRSKELFMRWAELNVFTPLFRCHEGNKPEKNVQFDHDEETLNHFAKMSRLFLALSPYLHHLKQAYYLKGTPVNRPLFYHFDEKPAFDIQDQFLYGSELLISPVIKDQERKHQVYLPKGNWIQMFTREKFSGGYHDIDSPLGRPLAFYLETSSFRQLFDSIQIQ